MELGPERLEDEDKFLLKINLEDLETSTVGGKNTGFWPSGQRNEHVSFRDNYGIKLQPLPPPSKDGTHTMLTQNQPYIKVGLVDFQ